MPDTMQFCALASRGQARLMNGGSASSPAILPLQALGGGPFPRRWLPLDGSPFSLRSPGCYMPFLYERTLSAPLPQGSPVCALRRETEGTLVLGLALTTPT